MRVKDKVAVVTGAGRGLGEATALRLAEEGARLVVSDVDEAGAQQTAARVRELGREAIVVLADVSVRQEAVALMEAAVKQFGRIDILVNNAGITRDVSLRKMTEEDWDRVLDINLKGSFNCAQSAARYMIEQKSGKIINISSRAYLGNPGQANYSASKAGILGLTRALALELGRYNINVNAIAPGMIRTPGVTSLGHFEKIVEKAIQNTPLGRIGEPIDVANVVLFLASEESSYMTGDVLHVTGGRYG
ncbi:MAG: 3-oxoacyl-ACP reductase FabG [Candidatus Tectomicrobia bacterium]|uniref:3-oxoacyl-[acyl-carrier-protein] reductase FabG n=1 Tax=Tectimicrobiota bacterium TaxID=2528274 RepID=A0A932G0C9_UNCTE|nr:3-oxoacyl-ACP reductase FabG [Candidatus Tectomicrobia bacterium]